MNNLHRALAPLSDAAWAQIVAGFDTTAAAGPVPPWPVAEDVDRDRPDGDDTDGSPGPAGCARRGGEQHRGDRPVRTGAVTA